MRSTAKVLLLDYVGELFSNNQKAENSQLVLPIGLMYLSSYVKSKLQGVTVRLVKSYVDFTGDDELLAIVDDYVPDIIGIRCLSLDIVPLFASVRRIRDAYTRDDYLIVIGGPITNAETAKVYNSRLFDYVVVNEGERAFCAIVSAFMSARPVPSGVTGIVCDLTDYTGDLIDDLDELPFPDYDLVDFGRYDNFLNYGYNRARQGVLVTSRGCPFRCTFCHNIMGRRARLRSAANIVAEIVSLERRYGIHDFFIVDDIFNIDYQRAMEVFDLILREGLDVHLYFPNGIRGDIVDRPYIDKMVDAGTKYVSFAVETASERLQKMIRKHIKLGKLKELIQYTCDKGIMVNGFFMFGMPSETEEEALVTLRYAEELDRLHFPYVFFARYYEGTEMYGQAVQAGFTDDMLYHSVHQMYHDIDHYSTPTLSNEMVKYIKDYFLWKIIFNPKRIAHVLDVERRYHTERQTLDMIHSMYNVRVASVGEFTTYVDRVSQSGFVRQLARPRAAGGGRRIIPLQQGPDADAPESLDGAPAPGCSP